MASDIEKAAAKVTIKGVYTFLNGRGWPEPIAADSGSGYHLLYKIDLSNDQESRELISNCLKALSLQFDDQVVSVDISVFNASRIVRLYGTINAKGENLPERPHRRSAILKIPGEILPVTREQLEALAGTLPKQEQAAQYNGGAFDLQRWIDDHRVTVKFSAPWNNGRKWILDPCPWNSDHTGGSAFIIQQPGGAIGAGCHHNSCQGNGWHELRDVHEPGWRDVKRARQPEPQSGTIVKNIKVYNRTDTGNAARLVDTFGAEFRYSYQLKKWIIWTGKRWEIDDSGMMYNYVRELSRQMQRDVLEIDDTEKRKKAFEWALSLEKAGNIENCLKCAQSFPEVVVKPTIFDKDPWLFNCQNGTLNLVTGELRPHRQGDYLMKISPASFDPDAKAPTWEAFLDRIMEGSREKIEFLKRAAGYSLTGITNEQVLFFLYGIGGNGKSRFVMPLQKILNDYCCSISTEVLMFRSDKDGGRGATPQLARLLNIRFVVASETDEGGRLSESLIKQLTGEDVITARHLHCEPFDFIPAFKLWLYGNHKPVIRGDDEGIWRRVILIPFEAVIPDEEKDLHLLDKLNAERDGIFTWMVQGCFDWQQIGLQQPEEVASATREYRSEMDQITNFMEECCHVAEYASVMASDVYEKYRKWCGENGEKERSQRKFGGNLKARGFINERTTGNRVIWRGIGLVDIPRADSKGGTNFYTG
jgi:P4 family phage/plasmid primase-like protien